MTIIAVLVLIAALACVCRPIAEKPLPADIVEPTTVSSRVLTNLLIARLEHELDFAPLLARLAEYTDDTELVHMWVSIRIGGAWHCTEIDALTEEQGYKFVAALCETGYRAVIGCQTCKDLERRWVSQGYTPMIRDFSPNLLCNYRI